MRRPARHPGIYVERVIAAPAERVWELTQVPELHERWDLRFSRITYLPRDEKNAPQRFLYETRIGFGLAVRGTGESVATRRDAEGVGVSSLQFASDSPLSLIREGAGYWRYVPLPGGGTRFLTWYDYRTRFGVAGRVADRLLFRPLMGWATAWSFDRLALWAENGTPPELSRTMAAVHAVACVALAGIWLWHGLVPKLLFHDRDEQRMLLDSHVAGRWLPVVGWLEIALAVVTLLLWRWRGMFVAQAGLMVLATAAVAVRSPEYLTHAFNPVTLNGLVVAVAAVGWLAAPWAPTASRCLRADSGGKRGKEAA